MGEVRDRLLKGVERIMVTGRFGIVSFTHG
jgi:hypothetical protein